MLQSTFIHLPGVGQKTERAYWNRGLTSWQGLLNSVATSRSLPGFDASSNDRRHRFRERLCAALLESERAIEAGDATYFSTSLPPGEAWRVLDEFRSKTVFLDIESTGLSRIYHVPTIVGCYDGNAYHLGVAGHNLDAIREPLAKAAVVVTFNGTGFDLPFLRAHLPGLKLPPVHVDLRFLLRRLGLVGGLKSIEAQLGLERPEEGLANGRQAVELWYRYKEGDMASLRRLVAYNYYDTIVLANLADYACVRLSERLSGPKCAAHPHGFGLEDYARVLPPPLDELLAQVPAPSSGAMTAYDSMPFLAGQWRVVGIDLTGSEKRPSGWALIDGKTFSTKRVATDGDLIRETVAAAPDLVSIDSPLSVPPGTRLGTDGSVLSWQRIYRDSELELKRRGISVFWCLLPTMQALTMRGIRLTRELRSRGLKVIESFPGAAQDILAIPRKGKSVAMLARALEKLGLQASGSLDTVSHDELDAITSAFVGLFYLEGKYEALGSETDDLIVPRV